MSSPFGDLGDVEQLRERRRQGPFGDLSDVTQFRSRHAEAARQIVSTLGFEPSPTFGESTLERVAADALRGAATSLPGQIGFRLAGEGERLQALEGVPTAQPIPGLPDIDTLTRLGVDFAALSPLARGLVSAGVGSARFLFTQPTPLQTAAARSIALGSGFAGLEAAAGAPGEVVAFAGVAGGGAELAGPLVKLASDRIGPLFSTAKVQGLFRGPDTVERTERAIARLMDTEMMRLSLRRTSGDRVLPMTAEPLLVRALDDISEGLGERVITLSRTFGADGKFISNIPELRRLGSAWDDAVNKNMGTLLDRAAGTGQPLAQTVWKNFRGFVTSVDQTLRTLGPAGQALAQGVRRVQRSTDGNLKAMLFQVDDALKSLDETKDLVPFFELRESLRGRPQEEVRRILAGLPEPLKAVARLLDEDAPRRLRDAGITFDDFVPGSYVPHLWDFQKLEQWVRVGANRRALAERIGSSEAEVANKVADLGTDRFQDMLQQLKITGDHTRLLRTSVDFKRKLPVSYQDARELGMPILSPKTIIRRYIGQIAERSSVATEFGVNLERLGPLHDQIGSQFGSTVQDFVREAVFRSIGLVPRQGAFGELANIYISNIAVPSKLALAVVSNAGQSINTISDVGLRAWTRGLRELLKEQRRLARGGVTPNEFIRGMKVLFEDINGALQDTLLRGMPAGSATGSVTVGARSSLGKYFLDLSGFNAVERFNRMVAALAGKRFVEDNIARAMRGQLKGRRLTAMRKEFKTLGLDLDRIVRNGGPTMDELFTAGLEVSNRTQFRVRPVDLPLFWSNPSASVFRFLKTFAFNQTRFIKNRVVKRAAEGIAEGNLAKIRPLATFALGVPVVGGTVGTIRDTLKAREPFEGSRDPVSFYLDSLAWVGGFGIFGDALRALEGGQEVALEFAFGPAASDAVETAVGVAQLVGGDPKPLGKRLVRSVPFLAQNIGGSREFVEEEFGLRKRRRR